LLHWALHPLSGPPALVPCAAAVQSLKPEIMFRVQPAYYELGPKVAAAINQAINVGQSECAELSLLLNSDSALVLCTNNTSSCARDLGFAVLLARVASVPLFYAAAAASSCSQHHLHQLSAAFDPAQ
jgi:hypothetical protein